MWYTDAIAKNNLPPQISGLSQTEIEDYLGEIQLNIDRVLELATDFDGYELEDEAVEILNDKIKGL